MNTDIWYIMHNARKVASVRKNGLCKIYFSTFMPYNLYLEESDDIDDRICNLNSFYNWCASRVLSLDRKFAKEILNSIGAKQATTDKDRAEIALSYHCLSLSDVYWVQHKGENLNFSEINLFNNRLDNAFVDVALKGRQMTIQNSSLIADDISTVGCFPKAWIRKDNEILLLKDGGEVYVENEIIASHICRCFQCNQVLYEEYEFEKQPVSRSKLSTSLDYGHVSFASFTIYCVNRNKDAIKEVVKLDKYGYYMMNILDYLIGNNDRHWENWGLLIDNKTNRAVRMYDLMDFNQAFAAYDNLDGANSLTSPGLTQREAAQYAVKAIGLNQITPVTESVFQGDTQKYDMFTKRLKILKETL